MYSGRENSWAVMKGLYIASYLFPDIENLEDKMTELNLGADTTLFEPIKKSQRAENVKKLETVIQGKHSAAIRKVAVERYNWSSISKRFYNDLEGLEI
jgi:hypothetical protein